MKFNQFQNNLNKIMLGERVVDQAFCYGYLIQETENRILIDGNAVEFSSLEEAKEHIKQQILKEEVEQEVEKEIYEEISNNKIATIIKEYYNGVKVTDTLIESFVELASSKLFTANPVAYEIRKINKLDRLVENKVDYKLNDGSIVAIDEETQEKINNLFNGHDDIINYMRESKDNFLSVVEQIEG